MYTREDYMGNACTHQQYYSQFVTPGIISLVQWHIGEQELLTSTNPHFNDIPMAKWDRLSEWTQSYINTKEWTACENPSMVGTGKYPWSLSSNICILKAAAHMIVEELTKQSVDATI